MERKENKIELNDKPGGFAEGSVQSMYAERDRRKKEIFEKIHIRNFVSSYSTWIKNELNM